MRRRNGSRPREISGWLRCAVVIAAVISAGLASGAAVVAAARTVDLAPKVGDILVFRPGARLPSDWAFNAVIASDQLPVSCVLKPIVMASAGGSLVVERRSRDSRLYHVHWAGRQTSDDDADCGVAADLFLSVDDLQLLSNVVGGPGVEHRAFTSYF